jgi:preprotein translocase subunit SecF
LLAALLGLALVAVFMVVNYRLPGVVAVLALSLYALFNLAFYALIPVTLTLPGIAGFILSLGMAVDANVLIFERINDELRAGNTLIRSIDAGFSQALSSILDGQVTTLISCLALFALGTGFVKGFAVTLGIGVLISLFSALVCTRVLLRLLMSYPNLRRPSLFHVPQPAARRRFLIAMVFSLPACQAPACQSTAPTASRRSRRHCHGPERAGLGAAQLDVASDQGAPLRAGLDFTGGTQIQDGTSLPGERCEPLDLTVSATFNASLLSVGFACCRLVISQRESGVAAWYSLLDGGRQVVLRMPTLAADQARAVMDGPEAPWSRRTSTLSGLADRHHRAEPRQPSCCARVWCRLGVSFLGISAYITLRYDRTLRHCWHCSVWATIVLITCGVFAWFGLFAGVEVNSLFAVALLTIGGLFGERHSGGV